MREDGVAARPAALPQPTVDRFRADVLRLDPAAAAGPRPFAVAVSGGPDSLTLLALAASAFPGRVIAATVDHRLRAESADEAALVGRHCEALAVPHATLPIEVLRGASGNLHAWARQERYLLLRRWAVDHDAAALCTAHHADDQAETFLMRAARAAGLSGLAAVRASDRGRIAPRERSRVERLPDGDAVFTIEQRDILLLRPLLRWRRAELREIVNALGLAFVDDPSNDDLRFERVRFRQWLSQAPWLDPVKIARSAEHIADAEADLLAVSHWLREARALPSTPHEVRLDVSGLPRGVRRYLARIAISDVGLANGLAIGTPDEVGNVEKLLAALEAGGGGTHADVQASARGEAWHFRRAPSRRAG